MLDSENVSREEQSSSYQVDVRYHGQGLLLTIDVTMEGLQSDGLDAVAVPFDRLHEQLFTFALDADKELVNVRAVAQGTATLADAPPIEEGGPDPSHAAVSMQPVYMEGEDTAATIYDRTLLKSGNAIEGPAIVVEMDSTTVILPGHTGSVDRFGNLLIRPNERSKQA